MVLFGLCQLQQEAQKAMKGDHVVDGVKYKFFWRNLAKARRKSVEDVDQQRPAEEKRRSIKRPEIEMDDAVREELESISGIDYLMTEIAPPKRKSVTERDVRKKSCSQLKTGDMDLEAREGKEESYESRKR